MRTSGQKKVPFDALGAYPTLSALDELEIISSARNLDDFLSRPSLVESYFSALQNFFGSLNFPRESFDYILQQLRQIKEDVPGLKDRLWETSNLGTAFFITGSIPSTGRTIHSDRWNNFYFSWVVKLDEAAKPYTAAGNDTDRRTKLLKSAKKADREIKEFQSSQTNGSAQEKRKRASDFYRALRKNSEYTAAAAYFVRQTISGSYYRQLLLGGNADVILHTLLELRSNIGHLLSLQGIDRHSLQPMVKDFLPDCEQLIADENIFPRLTKIDSRGKVIPIGQESPAVYSFTPIPRRIHGIWKGIAVNDCLGGTANYLSSTTPRRWATIAVDNSQLYYVTKRAHGSDRSIRDFYHGFIHFIPVQDKSTGQIFASTELICTQLKQKHVVPNAENTHPKSATLFTLWLDRALRMKPPEWNGFLISESHELNHAGVLNMVRTSLPFVLGQPTRPTQFLLTDPMIEKLVACSASPDKGKKYGNQMIFDASVPDAQTLMILDPQVVTSEMNGKTYERLLHLVDDSSPLIRWRASLILLSQGIASPEVLITIIDNLERSLWPAAIRMIDCKLGRGALNRYTRELRADSIGRIGEWIRYAKEDLNFSRENREPEVIATLRVFDRCERLLHDLSRKDSDAGIREYAKNVIEALNVKSVWGSAPGELP